MMMQTRTSIIHLLLYTLQFVFLSSHATPRSPRALSLISLPYFRGLRSVPLQPISSGYDRKPRPASGTRRRLAPVPYLVTTTTPIIRLCLYSAMRVRQRVARIIRESCYLFSLVQKQKARAASSDHEMEIELRRRGAVC